MNPDQRPLTSLSALSRVKNRFNAENAEIYAELLEEMPDMHIDPRLRIRGILGMKPFYVFMQERITSTTLQLASRRRRSLAPSVYGGVRLPKAINSPF